jgi:hypothetical protein
MDLLLTVFILSNVILLFGYIGNKKIRPLTETFLDTFI